MSSARDAFGNAMPRKQLATKAARKCAHGDIIKYQKAKAHRLQAAANDFGALLAQADLSDLTLVMDDGVRIPVHRVIIASRSPVFRAMLFGDMREASAAEVAIKDVGSFAMQKVCEYIYKGCLPDIKHGIVDIFDKKRFPEDADQAAGLIDLASAADRFQVNMSAELKAFGYDCAQGWCLDVLRSIPQGALGLTLDALKKKALRTLSVYLDDLPRERDEELATLPPAILVELLRTPYGDEKNDTDDDF